MTKIRQKRCIRAYVSYKKRSAPEAANMSASTFSRSTVVNSLETYGSNNYSESESSLVLQSQLSRSSNKVADSKSTVLDSQLLDSQQLESEQDVHPSATSKKLAQKLTPPEDTVFQPQQLIVNRLESHSKLACFAMLTSGLNTVALFILICMLFPETAAGFVASFGNWNLAVEWISAVPAKFQDRLGLPSGTLS